MFLTDCYQPVARCREAWSMLHSAGTAQMAFGSSIIFPLAMVSSSSHSLSAQSVQYPP